MKTPLTWSAAIVLAKLPRAIAFAVISGSHHDEKLSSQQGYIMTQGKIRLEDRLFSESVQYLDLLRFQ